MYTNRGEETGGHRDREERGGMKNKGRWTQYRKLIIKINGVFWCSWPCYFVIGRRVVAWARGDKAAGPATEILQRFDKLVVHSFLQQLIKRT